MKDRRSMLRWSVALALGAMLALWWAHVHESGTGEVPGPAGNAAVEAGTAASVPASHAPGEIAWFAGTVDEAFAAARETGKPVFLYWGAAWCPPCNLLKATVFRRPDFIERTTRFVAVYLDGDAEGAQAMQDRFGAMGYPTLIVFDSAGTEITRIPGGMDIGLYMDVLGLALDRVQPVASVLRHLLDEGGEASPAEWHLLATYSWFQDAGRALGERERAATLGQLVARIPHDLAVDRAMLIADYLSALGDPARALLPAERDTAIGLARELLGDAEQSTALRAFLGLGLADFVQRLDAGSGAREELQRLWGERLAEARETPGLVGAERLWVLRGEVALAAQRGLLDEDFLQRVRQEVDAGVAAATDLYSRSAVLNAALGVLEEAGQQEHAETLLRAQLADDEFGYYWMLDLAALAEENGHVDEAREWLRRAFDEAEGPATRIQWGSVRVAGLVRMTPADTAAIAAALDEVLGEFEGQQESVHGRNRQALERMRAALVPWAQESAERANVLGSARERLGVLCAREFTGDAASLARCQANL